MIISIALATILAACYVVFLRGPRPQQSQHLPPGPPTLPILGNLHQIPKEHLWRTIKQWHDQYGPIICVRFGSLKMILLGNYEVTHDLLEKRGSKYSSRPKFLADRVSNGLLPTFLPFKEKWKTHHRLHTSLLTIQASQHYQVVQDVESKQMVYELLSTKDFPGRFQRYASSQIFSLAYGKRMPRGDEPEVRELEDVMNGILESISLGEEVFPILKWLPDRLAPWRGRADHLPKRQTEIFSRNMKLASESASWNWAKAAKTVNQALGLSEPELWYNVGALYEAGTDSTAIVLEVFVMACVLHPDVVRRAHEELDSVVGMRMPTFEDLPNLPYIKAIVSEVFRWRHPSPGGLHHAADEDDVYRGFSIPKGTAVVANHFSLDTDESIFDRPFDFDPDRWIRNPHLPVSAFGFGRRACPGLYVGQNSVSIAVSRLLWAYDIGYAYENGQRLEVDPWDLTQGIGVRPSPFQASFQVRGEKRQEIISQAWVEAEKDVDILLQQASHRAPVADL
ncbi:Cytochrome P450 [Aspergillus parasiticus SU-1]|uniref:Cytochrome P450 n=1 Tax=Aspergillus parasiticus (strain ATCC 56775 / NRRL 5862 / SRRC 143 / SU-1) TaxID=1403190 RepID=A0A0F0IQ97_ASPPU|nr:Cytochrome P450 [Aspergillus parasiticus SU-1]